MVQNLEIFSLAAFTTYLWQSFEILIMLSLALNGIVSYRFRETRSLTFHQFFEARYSKSLRIFASFLNFVSGALSFAIQPVLGARFIVYFCNLPLEVKVGSLQVPTIGILMVALLTISLYMTMTGGQISVMLTNCLEGLVSGIFYIVVAVSILWIVSYSKMEHVMIGGPPGLSLVNPLDIAKNPKFDGSYILMLLGVRLFSYRGSAWQAGFAASARTPHEGKMAGILTTWRGIGSGLMTTLLGVGALVLLHHSSYAAQAAIVSHRVAGLTPAMRIEMQMPAALGLLLPAGARGALRVHALWHVGGFGRADARLWNRICSGHSHPFAKTSADAQKPNSLASRIRGWNGSFRPCFRTVLQHAGHGCLRSAVDGSDLFVHRRRRVGRALLEERHRRRRVGLSHHRRLFRHDRFDCHFGLAERAFSRVHFILHASRLASCRRLSFAKQD